jgi:hypothetical protein
MSDLVNTLLLSTAKYAVRKVPGLENSKAYMKASSHAEATVKDYGDDVNMMLTKVKKLREDAQKNLMPRSNMFSDPNKYYLMGLDHALDVVSCLAARFENGYSSEPEVFIKNILARSKYED